MTTLSSSTWERIKTEEAPQAARIAEWMVMKHPGATVLDVGCGPGIYVDAMRARGLPAYGVDGSELLVETDYLEHFDVTTKWSSKTMRIYPEVVLSLEVGEHIPFAYHREYISMMLDTFTNEDTSMYYHNPVIYFSAARPGQGGDGHIACANRNYWVEQFHKQGFWYDVDATEEWLDWIRQGPHMGWLPRNGSVYRLCSDARLLNGDHFGADR